MRASRSLLRRIPINPAEAARARPSPPLPRRRGGKLIGLTTVFGVAAAGAYFYPQLKAQFAGDVDAAKKEPVKAELEFEAPRKQARSKSEHRELLSSQHLQVQKSWEHPGVYAWGSNAGKVIDPDSSEKNIKLPRRIKYFDDQILRDLKLTQNFGAAVTEKGDLVQWGLGFSNADPKPSVTIKGKDLVKIDVSADRIIALSSNGSVYAIPASRDDLKSGLQADQKSSSMSLWSSSGALSPRNLTPSGLTWGEKVTDISSGLEHCLLLTSSGRVFSAASSSTDFPSKGQMGIPGLTWVSRPSGPYDQPHEVAALKGFKAAQIATGDFHSAILDQAGRVFTFGDNLFGQLGVEVNLSEPFVDVPEMLATNKLYKGTGLVPKVTSIVAGGNNTYFTVDAEAPKQDNYIKKKEVPAKRMPKITSDLWSAGQGVYGSLGTGKWTHVSIGPTKVKSLSSLFEFDESSNKLTPIKLKSLSAGTTHCAAVMDNVTETSIAQRGSENDCNWGADVKFWGGNEHYQLGTGKRNNLNAPAYIGPLDGGEGDAEKGRKGEAHRLCITPRETARIGEGGKGRKVTLEQKVECGRYVTGVYSST